MEDEVENRSEVNKFYQFDKKTKRRKYIISCDKYLVVLNGFTEEEAKTRAQEEANKFGSPALLKDVTFFSEGYLVDIFKPQLWLARGGIHG